MRASNPSDVEQQATTAPARQRFDLSDAVTLVGVAAIAVGAGLFHPGAGAIAFGVAMVFIGTRGAAGAPATRGTPGTGD